MLEELVRIGIDLARARDVATLSQRTVEHARRLTRAETGMLFLREQTHLRLVEIQRDEDETPLDVGPMLQGTVAGPISLDSSSVPAQVAATGTLLNIPDLSAWHSPEAFPPGGRENRSALVVPLSDGTGEAIGILALLNARGGDGRVVPFDVAYEEPIGMLAAHAAAALDKARSYEAVQEQLRAATALLAGAQTLSGRAPLEEMMRRVGREVARAIGADAVGTYVLDARKEALVPVAGYRLPKDLLEMFRRTSLVLARAPGLHEAIRDQRVIWSGDGANDPRFDRKAYGHVAPHSALFAPTVARGEAIGGLYIAWWRTGREFLPAEIRLIEAIATQAGVALENARLFEENRRQVKELSVLHALSRAVTGELDRRALIDALYAQVALVFDTRDLLILLPGPAEREGVVALRIRDGVRESTSSERCSMDHAGLAAVVMKTGLPVRTDDYAGECARHGIDPSPGSPPIRHWLGVPMTAGDSVLGVVALASAEHAFTAVDESLLTNIARLAALALRIARLSEERETAYSELYLLSLIAHRALRRWHESPIEPER